MRQLIYFVSLLLLIFLFIPYISYGQENGIIFEGGLSWQQIKDKAKQENKILFIDCYTTWCGPCKYMNDKIFALPEVGKFFNSHFINVAVQMDKTSKDAKSIQNWYGAAEDIKQIYKVAAYPTYLFFAPDGKLIHEFIGTSPTGAEFLNKASAALDPHKQYFTLLSNWREHLGDSVFLMNLLVAAKDAQDDENARLIVNSLIDCLKSPITKANINLFAPLVITEANKGFRLYLENVSAINLVMEDSAFVEKTLGTIIFKEEVAPELREGRPMNWRIVSDNIQNKYPSLNRESFSTVLNKCLAISVNREIIESVSKKEVRFREWDKMYKEFKQRYLGYDCGMLLLGQEIQYYSNKRLWPECAKAVISLIDRYGNQLGNNFINDICWHYIFLQSNDKKTLMKSLKFMERVVRSAPEDCADLDTYANLLYKAGHRQAAMDWEERAITISKRNKWSYKDYKDTLAKMQKGEPTWKDVPIGS